MAQTDPDSTRELIARASDGNRDALSDLCERYLPPLQRWARGRLPNYARDLMDTEDLVQESLIGAVRRLGNFEPRHSGAFHGYLKRAVQNRIRDEIRKVGRRPAREGSPSRAADLALSPLENAIGAEMVARYEAALKTLSERHREAVIARLEFDLSYREVAETTGYPTPDAARMAVGRALVQLAEELSHA